MPPKPAAELPVLSFESKKAFAAWLAKNHAQAPGVWLQFAKKGSGIASVTYAEAVEVSLCWGWIDGQAKSLDDRLYLQRFTPRRPKSVWSKVNCAKAEALIESGAMKPAGLAAIEAAKADGRWDQAYDSPKNATVPEDLAVALAEKPKAKTFFESLSAANRYAILWRLQTARKPETRARRLNEYVAMLQRGETFH